jgi:signal transduction histidine kinase/CheY-like chemotaxis protein/HAMP domain-containing protein
MRDCTSTRWSLRARLTALLLATLIPLAGLGVYWIAWEARDVRGQVERETQGTAALVGAEAGRIVGATVRMLEVLARLPSVQVQDHGEAGRFFRGLLATSPHLDNIFAFAADGSLTISAVPVPPAVQISVRDRSWFQTAVRSVQPVIGDFEVDRITGNPMAVLAQPIVDRQGHVVGVVGAALRLAAVSQEVAPARIKAPLLWAVVDGNGIVLLHSEPWGTIGKPLGPLSGMLLAEAVAPDTPWRVVVGLPEAVVAGRVRVTLLGIGLTALLVLVTVTGVALSIARNIWRPLQALAFAVRSAGTGEPRVSIPVEGTREVVEVATAFQQALDARDRRYGEVTALLDATRAVASSLDLQPILQAIVRGATTISGAPVVRLFLVDEDARVLRCRVGVGLPPEEEAGLVIPITESFSGEVAASGKPLAVADTRGDPRLRYPQHATKYGLLSYLGLPVKLGGRVCGVLVFNTNAPRTYSEAEVTYLSAFADQAAIAIENSRLYERIQKHAASLEGRVRDRTAELEEALRVKVEFLGKMSHELRTPLNFILGFCGLLREGAAGPLTPRQAHFLDRIHDGGTRLRDLVTDVLDIAQMEAGKSRLHLEPIRLDSLVDEALDAISVQASQKSLVLAKNLEPGDSQVVADRGKLSQILFKMLGNAVKFTPAGGTVRVTARQLTGRHGETENRRTGEASASMLRFPNSPIQGEGEFAEIAVEDTGIGIPPADLERIFAPFQQVDGSTTRAHGGAGVGLTLVRQLVELHGGQVWAESAGLGHGARFVVRLPRLEVPRTGRVLLVEDEVAVMEALCVVLESRGLAVQRARNGTEALAALGTAPPDLVILDIGLPDMVGWEVLRRLREEERTRDLPVLVLTNPTDAEAGARLQPDAEEFLAKPVSARMLEETVVRLLESTATAEAGLGREAQ